MRDAGIAHMTLAVEGVGCAACIRKIEGGLEQIPGILAARLNFTNRRLAVDWRDGELDPASSSSRPCGGSAIAPIRSSRNGPRPRKRARRRWLLRCLAVAGFAAMNVMLLSVSVWSGNVSDMTPETRDFFHWLSALIALAGRRLMPGSRSSRARCGRCARGSSTWTCRSRSASCSRSAMSVYRDREPRGARLFRFGDHAAVLPAVRPLSRSRDAAQDARGRRQSRGVAGRRWRPFRRRWRARARAGGRAQAGRLVLVRPGERVAADGIVIAGASEIDESLVTGETAPPRDAPGAARLRRHVNFAGALTMRVTRRGDGTLLDEIERLLQKAIAGQSRATVRLADRAARLYAPVVHVTALADRARLARRRRVAA